MSVDLHASRGLEWLRKIRPYLTAAVIVNILVQAIRYRSDFDALVGPVIGSLLLWFVGLATAFVAGGVMSLLSASAQRQRHVNHRLGLSQAPASMSLGPTTQRAIKMGVGVVLAVAAVAYGGRELIRFWSPAPTEWVLASGSKILVDGTFSTYRDCDYARSQLRTGIEDQLDILRPMRGNRIRAGQDVPLFDSIEHEMTGRLLNTWSTASCRTR